MTKAQFLAGLTQRLTDMGHTPRAWTKGRWGFHTGCSTCGAFASCKVATQVVREFPTDTCSERREMLEQYRKTGK